MQERRVESRSIGGVFSELYLNVKLSVQLLMITWKTSQESIIMVLILNVWKIFQMLVPIFQMLYLTHIIEQAIFQIPKSKSTRAQAMEGVCANLQSLPFDAGSPRDGCE